MPVYYAYRSFDLGPTGKYLKRFEDDTILAWFQRYWDYLAVADVDIADRRLTEVLGSDGWFLWNPFHSAAEDGRAAPTSDEELLDLLRWSLEEERLIASPHAFQVFTEEDGEGGAVFTFDGHFLQQDGELAAYLLNEDWRLPSGYGNGPFQPTVEIRSLHPQGDGSGATYVVVMERTSKYPLEDDLAGGYRLEGARLSDLARHLCFLPPESDDCYWPGHLRSFPALFFAGVELAEPMETAFLHAVRSAPGEGVHWAAWSDWRQDRDQEPPGISLLRGAFERLARFPGRLQNDLPRDTDLDVACRELIELETREREKLRTAPHSLIHVENHLAQICLDVSYSEKPYYAQYIFFDDLWASAHADLANALLRFASRWDVLSAD
jgi:hypothetical protein